MEWLNHPNTPTWLVVLAILASLIYQAISTRGQWRKSQSEAGSAEADADVKVSGAWSQFSDRLDRENKELRARIEILEARDDQHEENSQLNRKRIQELEGSVHRLEREREVWQIERAEWRTGVRKLIEQLETLEIKPAWKPKTGPFDK